MICYAVIDTNVLVSSLLAKSADVATVQIMEKVIVGKIVPLYSKEIISEYREVLNRKKFNFSKKLVDYLINAIEKFGILVEPQKLEIDFIDLKDLPFYEVVMDKENEDSYLVTGNIKHFPKKPFIVTPRELINILQESIHKKE